MAVMIVPLHVRLSPVAEGRQESRQTEYPRGNQEPQVKEDYKSMRPAEDLGVPDALPSWHKIEPEKKAGVMGNLRIIQPDGTHDVEGIRSRPPPNIKQSDWDKQIDFWLDPKNAARAAQNAQNQAKSKEAMLRLRDLGPNTPTGVPYTEDQIMAMVRKGKQRGYIYGVGRVLSGQGMDVISINKPRCTHIANVDEVKAENKKLRKKLNILMKVVRSDDRMSSCLRNFSHKMSVAEACNRGINPIRAFPDMYSPATCPRGCILSTRDRITSTFNRVCHQTFRAAKTSLNTKESDSDDEEDYGIQRNNFGAPMYGPKPAKYLNCNDLMDRALALQEVLNPFRKICVWKKAVGFHGSLHVPLQHMEWKPDYKEKFCKKEEGDG
ncbi:hypothetical protein Tco_1048751 [Tanacetum coccineum]